MRRSLTITSVAAALLVAGLGMGSSATAAGVAASAPTATSSGQEEYLYSVASARATTTQLKVTDSGNETFRLTLSGVAPVTVFANRPFRDAQIISVKALVANWGAWFGDVPPNAVLVYGRPGRAPVSMVVELTDPSFDARPRTLSFSALRLARDNDPIDRNPMLQKVTTPSSMTDVSLFIDLKNQPRKES